MTRSVLLLALLLWGTANLAGIAGESFVHALPAATNSPTPTWLKIHEPDELSAATFATWGFDITPPEGSGDLAVTFYFTEKEGSFLRVYWQGSTNALTLCDNLYEGVAMPNQRTLLIPKSVLGTGGKLSVMAGTDEAAIQRIEWNWVTQATVAVTDAANSPALFRSGNQALRAEEVSGDDRVPANDQVRGSSVAAVLQDEPIRIEYGIDFVASLESVPPLARIEVQLLGVPLDRNIAVWVNGVPVNQLSLDVPDLADPGYLPQPPRPDGTPTLPAYSGWRKGTVFIPATALREGENQFRFTWLEPDATTGIVRPLALKNFFLQLNFDASTAP